MIVTVQFEFNKIYFPIGHLGFRNDRNNANFVSEMKTQNYNQLHIIFGPSSHFKFPNSAKYICM
jgi:hypothetical protein